MQAATVVKVTQAEGNIQAQYQQVTISYWRKTSGRYNSY